LTTGGPKRKSLLARFLARAAVAAVGLTLFFGLGYLGGWPFFCIIAVTAIIALGEYYSALQSRGMRPNVGLGWLCALLILYATQQTIEVYRLSGSVGPQRLVGVSVEAEADVLQLIMFVLMFCVAGTLLAQFKLRGDQSAVVNSATTVFGVVYVAVLVSYLLRMRYVDVPAITGFDEAGLFARRMGGILFVVMPVWICDTAAYLAGSKWGRIKLAPTISPNKTVEGSAAGFLAAILGGLLFGAWLHMPLLHAGLLGALMGVVGQLGDLGKSVLKRDIGIKNFGAILGPHGGALDRFDAVLFCVPLVYWYFWFILMRSAGV